MFPCVVCLIAVFVFLSVSTVMPLCLSGLSILFSGLLVCPVKLPTWFLFYFDSVSSSVHDVRFIFPCLVSQITITVFGFCLICLFVSNKINL